MKQVDKVSIGRMAFVIDNDAHRVLEIYLESLEEYYSANPAHHEILAGIEERIAELLMEKGYKDRTVSVDVVDEIINILGRPDDLKDGPEPSVKKRKRKLFRNPDNKIIGGVFGGFGAYLGVDPIIFRFIFAGLFMLSLFLDWHGGWCIMDDLFLYLIVVYILLQIIMPIARTREDKCAMYGEGTSVHDIQSGVEQGFKTVKDEVGDICRRSKFGSVLGRGIMIFLGLMLFLIGICSIVPTLCLIFGIVLLGEFAFIGMPEIISPILMAPAWAEMLFYILLAIVVIIPPIALIYWGVLLLFRLRSPRWRPGLVMILAWIVSVIAAVVLAISFSVPVRETSYKNRSTDMIFKDTVYIKFASVDKYDDYKVMLEGDRRDFNLIYISDDRRDLEIVKYPEINIYRSSEEGSRIGSHVQYLHSSLETMRTPDDEFFDFWSFDGDTITLKPIVFYDGVAPRDIFTQINIVTDDNTKFIISDPVNFTFDSNIEYSNIGFVNAVGFID